jgi:hypothetical protein
LAQEEVAGRTSQAAGHGEGGIAKIIPDKTIPPLTGGRGYSDRAAERDDTMLV